MNKVLVMGQKGLEVEWSLTRQDFLLSFLFSLSSASKPQLNSTPQAVQEMKLKSQWWMRLCVRLLVWERPAQKRREGDHSKASWAV